MLNFLTNNNNNVCIIYKKKKYTYAELKKKILDKSSFYKKKKKEFFYVYSKNKLNFIIKFYACIYAKKVPVLLRRNAEIDKYLKKEFKYNKNILFVIFTSGSEGKPKGIIMSKNAFMFSCQSMNKEMKIKNNQAEVIFAPLDHAFALGRCHSILSSGGTIFLVNENNYFEFFNFLEKNKNIGLSIVPSILATFIASYKNFSKILKNIKYIQTGAMKFPIFYRKKIAKLKNLTLYLHYGLSEMMRATFLNTKKFPRYLESEGRPFKGNKIKIEKNELFIKGKGLCFGYLDNKLWKDKLSNGWYQTGDLGKIKNGFFYFQGRKSNLINYNGIAFNSEYYEEKLKNNFDSEFCILPSKDRIRDNILNLITDNKNLKIKKINQFFLRDNKGIKVNNFFYLKKFPKTRTNKILRNKISIRNLIKIS